GALADKKAPGREDARIRIIEVRTLASLRPGVSYLTRYRRVSRESNVTVAACGSTGAAAGRLRCDSTRLTPPITATAATPSRGLSGSSSSATAPPAAITGTLSCNTAAVVAVSPRSARYQIA